MLSKLVLCFSCRYEDAATKVKAGCGCDYYLCDECWENDLASIRHSKCNACKSASPKGEAGWLIAKERQDLIHDLSNLPQTLTELMYEENEKRMFEAETQQEREEGSFIDEDYDPYVPDFPETWF